MQTTKLLIVSHSITYRRSGKGCFIGVLDMNEDIW